MPNRMAVYGRAPPTYVKRMVTAAARPHVFWVGEDAEARELVRGWPIGPALLDVLRVANSDVGNALADERARLSRHGYPEDLPLPALWWTSPARDGLVEVTPPHLTAA